MRMNRTNLVVLLSLVGCGTVTAGSIVDLGTLGGASSIAYAINGSGQVVGGAGTSSGTQHAVLWSDSGRITDLGTLGGANSLAVGIGGTGQVLGLSNTTGGSDPNFEIGGSAGFHYTNGSMTALPIQGDGHVGSACCTNSSGQILEGAYLGGFENAYLVSPDGSAVRIPPPVGGSGFYGESLNDSGQVAGNAEVPGGFLRAMLYSGGASHELGTLGGCMSTANSINNAVQVVGMSEIPGDCNTSTFVGGSHAFLYTVTGGMQDLGTLGGSTSQALGVNSMGEIVGESFISSGADHAFLYANGAMIDLNTLLPPNSGWVLEAANAINDSGQVVGYGISPSGQTHGFLLNTATPEPSTIVLMLSGSVLVMIRRCATFTGNRLSRKS